MSNLSSPAAVPRLPDTAAARLAKARTRARSCFLVGALLIPVILGAFWLKSGRLDPLAAVVAVGTSTLFDLLGAAQLVAGQRAMQRYRARLADKDKGLPILGAPLEIHFCKRSLGRLGAGMNPLLTGLRARGYTPVVRECLNCCQDCNRGMLVTMIDGVPMAAADGDNLLGDLDELAAAGS